MTPPPVFAALPYGSGRSQVGDLHLPVPQPGATAPVAVLIHGGFWREPYGRDLMAPLAEDLAARGFAAWNLEYRRLGGGGGWPATLLDIAHGVDHLAALAKEHPLDLERVIAIGHSAGGHLALWAAGRHRAEAFEAAFRPRLRVAAAVGQAPVADLARAHALRLSRDVVADFLGGTPEAHSRRYAAASPIRLLPLGVPQLIVHGEADDTVPVEIGRSYAEAARSAGDPVTFTALPGVGHYEHLEAGHPAWGAVTAWLQPFLLRSR